MTLSLHINVNKRRNDSWNARNEGVGISYLETPIVAVSFKSYVI